MAPLRTKHNAPPEHCDTPGYRKRDAPRLYTGEELIENISATCATAYSSLPLVNHMRYTDELIFTRDGNDKVINNEKILIGWYQNDSIDSRAYPVWAFLSKPFYLEFMAKGSKFRNGSLNDVALEAPFKYVKEDITTQNDNHRALDSLIAYYLVANGSWDKFGCNGKYAISIMGVQIATQRVHKAVLAGNPAGGKYIEYNQDDTSIRPETAEDLRVATNEAVGLQSKIVSQHRRLKENAATAVARVARITKLAEEIEDWRGKAGDRLDHLKRLEGALVFQKGVGAREMKRRAKLIKDVEMNTFVNDN